MVILEKYSGKIFKTVLNNDIPGGIADKMTLNDIAKKHNVSLETVKSAILTGVSVEKEHTKDEKIAFEIAKDHLAEDIDYYKKLKKIEKKIKFN
jgi:GTP:adenosylcobinamide-phosphate guanylyltransferase